MAEIDIFNPPVTKLAKGLAGKSMMWYSQNRCGKSLQASRMPKPLFFSFEAGLNAQDGIPYVTIEKWGDFIRYVKKLVKDKERTLETFQTIVVDTVDVAAKKCEEFMCDRFGVERINDAFKGFGCWGLYEDEFFKPFLSLTQIGVTVIFLAHESTKEFKSETGEEYTKIFPRGDKRTVEKLLDLVDLIVYISPNDPVDGKEVYSTAYFKNNRKFHSGSRFDEMPDSLFPFTAEGLEEAIIEAIEKKEAKTGHKAISFAQQQMERSTERKSFEELVSEIKEIATQLNKEDRIGEYKEIIEQYLGKDSSVKDATPKQSQQLELILDDLKDLISS